MHAHTAIRCSKIINNAHRQIQYGGRPKHFSQNDEPSIIKTTLATLSKKNRSQGLEQPLLPSEDSFCRLTVEVRWLTFRKNVQCIRTFTRATAHRRTWEIACCASDFIVKTSNARYIWLIIDSVSTYFLIVLIINFI